MNGTPTTTAYFQDTTGQPSTDRFSNTTDYVAKDSEDRDTFTENVEEGDYVAIAYQLLNGYTITINTGHVTEVNRVDGRFDDLRFGPDGENYLHLNPETGDYYFQDGRPESPEDGYRVEKVSYTPEEHVA